MVKYCIILFSFIAFFKSEAQSGWQAYSSPYGDFSINCPGGILNLKEKDIYTEVGRAHNKVFFIEFPDGENVNFLYSINQVSYPLGTFNTDSVTTIAELFEQTFTAISESLGYVINYFDSNETAKIPEASGRLYHEQTDTSIKIKLILHNDTLYTLSVYTNHPNKLNEEIDRFISSFRLKNL